MSDVRTCPSCGTAVAGGVAMYAAEAQALCPVCHPLTHIEPPARRSIPGVFWLAGAGALGGLVPFSIKVWSSSSSTINGVLVSSSYRDWVAIWGGVVAIVCGLGAMVAGRRASWKPAALSVGALLVLLGAYQLGRGFGAW